MAETLSAVGEEQLREALRAWPGFESATAEYLSVGLINQTWAIELGSSHYIAQRVNSLFSAGIEDNIQRVSGRLRERGLVSPRLLETASGSLSAKLSDGSRWRLMERLPGVIFRRCESAAQARSAAGLVARFHNALSDFEEKLSPIGFPFHDMPEHMADLERNLAEYTDSPFHHQVAELNQQIHAEVQKLGDRPDLPRRVIHGDLKFNNFVFEEICEGEAPRTLALIDLDTLAELPLYFDLGDAWRSWCNLAAEHEGEARLDLERFRVSAEAYLSAVDLDLSREELLSLTDALERLSLELCTRFAADVLAEDHWSWDPDRFESCAEHNWARAQGQWSLYQQARETHAERLRFILG